MDMYSQGDESFWDRNVSTNVTLNMVTFWLISLPINRDIIHHCNIHLNKKKISLLLSTSLVFFSLQLYAYELDCITSYQHEYALKVIALRKSVHYTIFGLQQHHVSVA